MFYQPRLSCWVLINNKQSLPYFCSQQKHNRSILCNPKFGQWIKNKGVKGLGQLNQPENSKDAFIGQTQAHLIEGEMSSRQAQIWALKNLQLTQTITPTKSKEYATFKTSSGPITLGQVCAQPKFESSTFQSDMDNPQSLNQPGMWALITIYI